MLSFKSERISKHVTRIFAFCTELMYLVEGEERAALLDTGSGFGDLQAYVNTLTDRPLIVLTTHGHVDHAMGAKQFADVWMSHKDISSFVEHGQDAVRWNMLNLSKIPDIRESITSIDYIPTDDPRRFHDLQEGDVFDLGDVQIEIFECAGHTPGSVVMLIREEQMLLLGDACNAHTFLFGTYALGVSSYQHSLEALKLKTDGRYRRVLISHGNGEGEADMIAGNIRNCQEILAGKADNVPYHWDQAEYTMAYKLDTHGRRTDGRIGNIIYEKRKIHL